MKREEFETFCRRWLNAWTGNQPAALREFYADDAFYRDPARPQGLKGEELLPYLTKLLARNPDWVWEALEIHGEGERFFLKWRATIPVEGKPIVETGLDLIEIRGQKISRNEVYFDRTALFAAALAAPRAT